MSVISSSKKFRIAHAALFVSCVLAQHSASARSDRDPIFFQATNLAVMDGVASMRATGFNETATLSSATFAIGVDESNIRARIEGLEETGDFHSAEIAKLSLQLGNALQAAGQHRAALEAYDRSFQIVRRLEGLYSAAQTSVLQAEINSHIALGDMETTDSLQQLLFSMQQQLLAEKPITLADAYLASADWNLKYYLQLRQTPVPGGRTDSQEAALANRLVDSFMQYHKSLWLLSRSTDQGHYDEKTAIERKIAALMLMVNRQYKGDMPNTLTKLGQTSAHQSKHAQHPALLRHGSAALQRAVEYSKVTEEPVLIAERQLELADWYLLMDQHDQARTTYATAVTSLREAGIEEQQISAIVESGLPVHNPEDTLSFAAEAEATGDFDGYIDVSFDLNRYGQASNTRVLAGTSYDEEVEEELLQRIHDGRFRPQFAQGTPVDSTEVTLRYYFAR